MPPRWQESKTYHEKHILLSPNDPEPYYWIGVIDWTLAYHGNKELREDYNEKAKKTVKESDPMPPAVASQFTPKYGQTVDEGITDLKKGHRAQAGL